MPRPGTARRRAGRRAHRARGRLRSRRARPWRRAPAGGRRRSAAPGSRRPGGRAGRDRAGPGAGRPAARTRAVVRRGGRPARRARCAGTRRGRWWCRAPRREAPRPRSSSPMTATSRIRGTLVSSHGSEVRRQAASSGRAAFLLPSTSTRPPSRWPPSTTSRVFVSDRGSWATLRELSQIDDLASQDDAESRLDPRPAQIHEGADVARRRAGAADDEVGVPLARRGRSRLRFP